MAEFEELLGEIEVEGLGNAENSNFIFSLNMTQMAIEELGLRMQVGEKVENKQYPGIMMREIHVYAPRNPLIRLGTLQILEKVPAGQGYYEGVSAYSSKGVRKDLFPQMVKVLGDLKKRDEN